jgi:SAM-dependent methyltransferase
MPSYYEARGIINPDLSAHIDKEILEELNNLGKDKKDIKILDIGCGYGAKLLALRNLSYTNIKGVETGKEQAEYCIKEGLPIDLITDLQDYLSSFSGEGYDCVIMWHVLEHLKKDEIIPILNTIYEKVLNDNGRLIIATPNAQSLIGSYWRYEDWTHDLIFTTGSLYFVLRMAGFKDIKYVDIYGASNVGFLIGLIRTILLKLYTVYFRIRNKFTDNAYFYFSQKIFTWQIKAVAIKKQRNKK